MVVTELVKHIIPISGKDSLCTAIVQQARDATLPYEYLFCDVKMELPETYAWLAMVEAKLGISIVKVGRSLEDVMAEQGMLPSHNMRFCTRLAKIHPLLDFLKGSKAVQYLGMRADEQGRIAVSTAASAPNVTNRYPLAEMGIDLPAVYAILDARGLLPPTFFWKTLHELVWQVLDAKGRDFVERLQPWHKNALFSWRSRSNCFMCFYQRQYEWAGLYEHHRDLFFKAMRLEQDYGGMHGARRALQPFWFREDYPLSWIQDNRVSIVKKRAKEVVKTVMQAVHFVKADLDVLATVGCGMYCGK